MPSSTSRVDIEGQVQTAPVDLSELASVRAFADQMVQRLDRLDLLINNAGIMACPLARVGPGWESQFGVNHMGHFALTQGLLPLLRRTDRPRVVCRSSGAHKTSDIRWDDIDYDRSPYDKWQAYGQAKTANALFANALSRRLRDDGGRAFAVHPGGIFTPLRHLPTEEMIGVAGRGRATQRDGQARVQDPGAGVRHDTVGCDIGTARRHTRGLLRGLRHRRADRPHQPDGALPGRRRPRRQRRVRRAAVGDQ